MADCRPARHMGAPYSRRFSYNSALSVIHAAKVAWKKPRVVGEAPVAQLAEARGLKPRKCRFESDREHKLSVRCDETCVNFSGAPLSHPCSPLVCSSQQVVTTLSGPPIGGGHLELASRDPWTLSRAALKSS